MSHSGCRAVRRAGLMIGRLRHCPSADEQKADGAHNWGYLFHGALLRLGGNGANAVSVAMPPPRIDMIAIMFDEMAPFLDALSQREFAFEPGSAVFHLGDDVKLIHFVRSGVIHLIRHQPDGASLVLQRAGPGSILAEASMFSDHYHCDARAVTAARTFAISRADLRNRISEDGDFAQIWAARLAEDVQQARLQAEILSIKTVAGRLDAWLSWHGAMPNKGEWAALAAEIGVSPAALYREIANQRSQGLLRNG
jgi:CRP/FNR family transcriptional regulator, dissimilatory nitrate respiration regulator